MKIVFGLSMNRLQSLITGGAGAVLDELAVLTNESYELTIVATGPDAFDITITIGAVDYGPFTVTQAQMEASQFNLQPAAIAGVLGTGELLTVTPGLWLVDPDLSLTASYQWQRDGVDISGETGLTYTTAVADEGTNVTVVETVGTDSASSNTLAIPSGATNLLDLPAGPTTITNYETPITLITDGIRLVQPPSGAKGEAFFPISENLVVGTEYRLTGTYITDSTAQVSLKIFIRNTANTTVRYSYETSPSLAAGTYPIDLSITLSGTTQPVQLYVSSDFNPVGDLDLLNFTLTEV